jgi:hypothetical protein
MGYPCDSGEQAAHDYLSFGSTNAAPFKFDCNRSVVCVKLWTLSASAVALDVVPCDTPRLRAAHLPSNAALRRDAHSRVNLEWEVGL